MTRPTDFSIQVQSEDPKKNDKPQDKDKLESSSKGAKNDGKEDEGEELVGHLFINNEYLTLFSLRKTCN